MWVKVYAPGTRKGNSTWIARGKDQFGRWFEKALPAACPHERAARRLADAVLELRNSNTPAPAVEPEPDPPPPDPDDRSFAAAAANYIAWRKPSKADRKRLDRLKADPTIGPIHVGALGTDHVVSFTKTFLEGRKASTLNREAVRPYAAVLHYAADNKWCEWTRIRLFVEDWTEPKPAAPETFAQLIRNADATDTYGKGARGRTDKLAGYKAALLMLLRLRGQRITDLLQLQRERDLDLPRALVRVTIGKARKRVKWLPLSAELVAVLANLKPCSGDRVFPWRSRSGVYKWLIPLRRRLGVEFTPHMARHALGTEMLEAEIDERIVMDAGAWANRKSLLPYQRVARRLIDAADAKRERVAAESASPPVGKRARP